MKLYLLSSLVIVVLGLGCSTSAEEKVKRFIPGAYVHFFEKEKLWDTLIFGSFKEHNRTFRIVRNMGFHRVIHNKLLPKEYKTNTAIGVFNPVTYQVQHQVAGTVYTFYPDRHHLSTASFIYEKID
jgi:hypothetical protein